MIFNNYQLSASKSASQKNAKHACKKIISTGRKVRANYVRNDPKNSHNRQKLAKNLQESRPNVGMSLHFNAF